MAILQTTHLPVTVMEIVPLRILVTVRMTTLVSNVSTLFALVFSQALQTVLVRVHVTASTVNLMVTTCAPTKESVLLQTLAIVLQVMLEMSVSTLHVMVLHM